MVYTKNYIANKFGGFFLRLEVFASIYAYMCSWQNETSHLKICFLRKSIFYINLFYLFSTSIYIFYTTQTCIGYNILGAPFERIYIFVCSFVSLVKFNIG